MTNKELGIPEYSIRKIRHKQSYVKSSSIKLFELDFDVWWYEGRDIPRACRVSHKFDDKTANGLTTLVKAWFSVSGYFAARVNTQGNYNAKLGRWVRSGSTSGMADVLAVVNGSSISIEVKIGRDKVRESQALVKAQIEAAGGIYLIVRSFDDFLSQYREVEYKLK